MPEPETELKQRHKAARLDRNVTAARLKIAPSTLGAKFNGFCAWRPGEREAVVKIIEQAEQIKKAIEESDVDGKWWDK